jgi:hypothetical protein
MSARRFPISTEKIRTVLTPARSGVAIAAALTAGDRLGEEIAVVPG